MEQPAELTVEVRQAWARPVVLGPVFLVLSLIGALFPSFSLLANLYVLALGGAMVWLGLSGRVPKRAGAPLTRAAAWWLVPVLALALVETVNFLLGSTYPHPTLSLLMDPVLDGYPARVGVYLAWLCGFWGLVRR